MIRRFYVHNFRCLENFTLPVADRPSVLLIGKNGSGKSTVGRALRILQSIARGVNRIDNLVRPKDLAHGRTDVPIRFEIEVAIAELVYKYFVALDLPQGFKELRVLEEGLEADGRPVFTRAAAQVHLPRTNQDGEAKFLIDWHLAALPIVQERTKKDPLFIFKQWLSNAIILNPIPALIDGNSDHETLQPDTRGTDFGAWFSGLIASAPAAYGYIDSYLKAVMPDLKDIKNPVIGKQSRSIEVDFSNENGNITIPFGDLSDGEKCFMICSMVLAMNRAYGPLLCFWDEPDSHLALSEVGHFMATLRKAFQSGGQFIATSHNTEAIRRFSDDNTLMLYRENHLEPTQIRPVSELQLNGELVSALIRDDVEP